MTAYSTTQINIVEELKNLLRHRYDSGFPVFKELLQNADDAGASRLLVEAYPGFADALNPLLRAPSLICANDGGVLEENFKAIELASGGSKAGVASAVGRFGLGQKAVYHLCDAFVAQAWIDGDPGPPRQKIMNPWEEIPEAEYAGGPWKTSYAADVSLLEAWARGRGFGQGIILVLPLRSLSLEPGGGLFLAEKRWTPQQAIEDMIGSGELWPTLSCLRNVNQIEAWPLGESPLRYQLNPDAKRLSSPDRPSRERKLGGSISSRTAGSTFIGSEAWCLEGQAAALKRDKDWPSSFDFRERRIAAKAEPHGAVLLCRSPAVEGRGELRIRHTVYLPVDLIERVELAGSVGVVDILLHAYLFVSSDRKSVLGSDAADTRIEARWNRALLKEATLPLLPRVLAEFLPSLGADAERRALIVALRGTNWWSSHSASVCGGSAVALAWNGEGEAAWGVKEARGLRPVPLEDAMSRQRLCGAWPNLADWCGRRSISLAYGPVLSAETPSWHDDELASLVREAGAAAFTKNKVAETLAALLRHAPQSGTAVPDALAEAYTVAATGTDDFARSELIRQLIPFMPHDRLLTLPRTAEHRKLIATLAGAGRLLLIKADWCEAPITQRLDISDAIDLLAAAEPLIETGSLGEQAAATVNFILRCGPALTLLAQNDRARHLAVVPAARVRDGHAERLTLVQLSQLSEQNLLFGKQPISGLDDLAGAISDPPIYRLFWSPNETSFPLGSKTQDLVHALRAARQFSDPKACGRLAVQLYEHISRDQLRRLVAMDAGLSADASLCELERLPGVLTPLVRKLLAQRPTERVVDPEVAQELTGAMKISLRLKPINARLLGDWLLDAKLAKSLPAINDHQAVALLKSGVADDVLKVLPLHRTLHGKITSAEDGLFLARAQDVPSELLSSVCLADLWEDSEAQAVQRRIIPRWNAVAQIRTALEKSTPSTYVEIIAEALLNGGVELAQLVNRLREARWISVDERAVSPAEILDLPENVDGVLRALVGRQAELATFSNLPNALRKDAVLEVLRELDLFPSRAASLEMAGMLAAEHGVTGLAIDFADYAGDWQKLANAGLELGTPGWKLIRAAFEAGETSGAIGAMVRELRPPGRTDIVAQMNALAEATGRGLETGAALKLYRAIFDSRLETVLSGNFLPADLLVPSRAGTFRRSDELALNGAGILRESLLHGDYAAGIDSRAAVVSLSNLSSEETRGSFIEQLKSELERFRGPHVPAEAILFILAMLGRDKEMRELASKWEEQCPFERICDDLDEVAAKFAVSKDDTLPNRIAELRFEVRSGTGDTVPALSAAGTVCIVPVEGHAWLVDCLRLEERRENGRRVFPYCLSLAPVSIDAEDQARPLLEDFVDRIAPALMLVLDPQRAALREKLTGYFTDDQTTLRDTQADLRQVIHDRLRGVKGGDRVKAALADFDRNRHRDPNGAAEELWQFVQGVEAAGELLEAVRRKIQEMGYAHERVLFELFQNADDTLEHWRAPQPYRFRVEAVRDDDGQILHLRILHWGRPINHLGSDSQLGRALGYGNDLANMLAIGHSAKYGPRQIGRFGLGFKTVHMLTDEARIASGRQITTRTRGGMIPLDWPEGRSAALQYAAQGMQPTLIDLPIAPGQGDAAERALEAFTRSSPWLAAIAPRIAQIELDTGGGILVHRATTRDIAEGVAIIMLSNGRRAFRLDLDRGFRLFLAFGATGPEEILEVRQFWHLVPLDGAERRGAWLIEGRFAVDPGRTQLSGSAEDQAAQFATLGRMLGPRLVALYDVLDRDWQDFAQQEGLDPAGRDGFWTKLVKLLARDLDYHGPERALHLEGRGLGHLLEARPLVPLPAGGFARAEAIAWRRSGAIADQTIFAAIVNWPTFRGVSASLVDEATSQLIRLLYGRIPTDLTLAILACRTLRDGIATPDAAALLGQVINTKTFQDLPPDEKIKLKELFGQLRFLAADGNFQPIGMLGFLQSEDGAEAGRAAFAPESGQLAGAYVGPALSFAEVARYSAGFNEAVFRRWAAWAHASTERRAAFLCFLAGEKPDTIRRLAEAAKNWMPPASELKDWPPLLATPGFLSILAALDAIEAPGGPISEPPQIVVPPPDATQAFQQIAEWWIANGHKLRLRYDREVYPEGFSLDRLHDDDDEAWFTMLGLATFQTLGRIKPEQSQSFVKGGLGQGWWSELAKVRHEDDLKPFIERLRAWSEPWQVNPLFGQWRRCLVDLCMVARFLDEYRRLFRSLPRILAREGDVSLRVLLLPQHSDIAGKMGIVAAPLAPSLGIGANWLVRELTRHGVYGSEHAAHVVPYGWSTAARVRRLFGKLGRNGLEHGIDAGRTLHAIAAGWIGEDAAMFGGDGDLALHVITTKRHRATLDAILVDAGSQAWEPNDYDEEESHEDD